MVVQFFNVVIEWKCLRVGANTLYHYDHDGFGFSLSVSGAVDGAFEKLYIGINTLTVGWAQQFDAI
jgi:hypothetical protein